MAINFPSNPIDNQTYTYSNQVWYWANTAGVWKANTMAIGYTGSLGFTGSIGIGYTGSEGYTGSIGSVGFTGSSGYTGSVGTVGYTGSEGYTGSTGVGYVGSQGDTGSVGYTGSAGTGGGGGGGGGATGGGSDQVFYENGANVTTDYTISTNKNALSAGPITINSGVTVTIPANSVWTIV